MEKESFLSLLDVMVDRTEYKLSNIGVQETNIYGLIYPLIYLLIEVVLESGYYGVGR